MSDLQQDQTRGQRAKDILEDPLHKESIQTLKDAYSEAIFQTGPKDEQARTMIYLAYHTVCKFETHLRTIMETGILAAKQLEELRKKK